MPTARRPPPLAVALPAWPARRRCLGRLALAVAGVGSAAGGLAGCAATGSPATGSPATGSPAAGDAALRPTPGQPQRVADGVYAVPGTGGEIDVANAGRVGNAGFIVGDDGVVVVDAGVSRLHGQALLQAIARTTDKPVRLLLLTHARQEFVFGACAFRARGIPVAMGRRSAQLMAARCDGCLKTLRKLLGDDLMAGTELVKPDILLDDAPAPLPAGWLQALAGFNRPLRPVGLGHSSGPGDVALLDERSGTLLAGGLADVQRIPDIQDADLAGWLRGLTALRGLPIRRIVPGHGPVAGADALAEVQRYLTELDSRARVLARDGIALSEVPDATGLPHFAAWDQYDTIHRRNASILFLRHERALLRE